MYFFDPIKQANKGLSKYYYLKKYFPTAFSFKFLRSNNVYY